MDFHSLTRKELQFLCKLNKIAANTKNHVMADALRDLDTVEGIEKFIDVSQSETVDLNESKENVEVSSPKVPITRNRTTTVQKVETTEVENLKPTNTRTTRRTAKKVAVGVEESKNEAPETPALSSTRRKALATSSCRSVNSQLNDCELDTKEDKKSPEAVVAKGRRKVATTSTTVKKEIAVQKTYGTRRSTRQTEKKSGEPRVRKQSEKAIEIITLSDDDDSSSDEVSTVEVPESSLNAEVEDICNALEEHDVDISEEKEDSGEVDNLKPESEEIPNSNEEGNLEEELIDGKPEKDDISSPIENGDLEEEKLESEVMVLEEEQDSVVDDSTNSTGVDVIEEEEEQEEQEEEAISDNIEDLNGAIELKLEAFSEINNGPSIMDSDMILDTSENPNENESNADEEISNDIKLSENTDDETSDAIAAIESISPEKIDLIVHEVDAKVEEKEEISEFDNQKSELSETLDVIPTIDSLSPVTEQVADHQPEISTEVAVEHSGEISDVFVCSSSIKENDVLKTPATSSRRNVNSQMKGQKLATPSTTVKKEATIQKTPATSSHRNVNSQMKGQTMELDTPATVAASSRRKVATLSTTVKKETTMQKTPSTSSRRNVNSQMKVGQTMESRTSVTVVASSQRMVATPLTTVKKEGTMQKEVCSRKSTRLTEKKCGDSLVKKVIEKTEKIDSLLDEVNAIFQEVFSVEVPENAIDSDAIMDSNETSKPCENVEFEEEKLELIPEEHSESFVEDNADVESDENSKACENVYFEEEKDDLIPEEHSESFVEDNADVEFVEKSKPCETVDFEGCSSIEEKNQLSPTPTTLFDLISHPTPAHPTTRRKTPATSSRRKEGEKMEWCTPGIATVRSSRRKVATTPSTTMKKEGTLQKEFSSRRSTRLTEKKSEKSTAKCQSENVMNFEEVFPEEVSENAMDAGNSDAKVEDVCNSLEELEMIPCENVHFEEEKSELLPEEHSESFIEDNAYVEHSENNVNGSSSMVNEKVDSDSCEENRISQISVPTPMKKIGGFVSDDKENKMKKEKDENVVMKENLQDASLRQLRKKLKALTLKTMNADNKEARPALQTLCENQLVGGETKN
ncbi:altered inheritance of mitochondria protein 21 isoform X2 [Lactuca sativa]|uniref:altered inheritance of mitochondria protein 21 isoform X2 n=1 Tax=Lactuca sativa TaxID=4236 RepID=UPI000CD9E426|nr:altered inheritance of mitochondria protein 21 isoform X2 [Lactuca sativa]